VPGVSPMPVAQWSLYREVAQIVRRAMPGDLAPRTLHLKEKTMAIATPPLPFDYKTWKAGTSITLPPLFDKVSRAKFEALDRAVDTYLTKRTTSTLNVLRASLQDWMQHKDAAGGPGAWAESARNRKYLIAHLNAAINGGDTDASFGIPEFMSPGMINARLGILYLFSHIKWNENVLRFVTSGVVDFTGKGDGRQARRTSDASKWLAKPGPDPKDPIHRKARDRVAAHLESLVLKVVESVAAQLPKTPGEAFDAKQLMGMWDAVPGGLKGLCRYLGDKALDHAAPFLANGVGVVEGLVKATSAGVDRYRAHTLGKGVAIVPGAPRTTVDGIKRAMDLQLATETYGVLKSAGSLTLEGLSAATAGAIVDIAFSVVEAFVSLVWRVYDYYRLRLFRQQARTYWETREGKNALHEQPSAFNEWYRGVALKVPAVACLTLASSICGDKMRLLRMFGKEGEAIAQKDFEAGVKHLDNLKAWGAGYLADLDYGFGSEDPVIAKLIATK
jgi:hypothetical protein